MATIPGVSDNELVRTTWGDAVADELNSNTVKKTAAQTMAGPLTVSDSIVANNHVVISDTPTASTHAATKGYVDTTTVATTGATMTGALNVGPDSTSDPFSEQTGCAFTTTGAIGSLRTAVGINLSLYKASAAYAADQTYVGLFGQNNSTVTGSIKKGSGAFTIFDAGPGGSHTATSDYRLKDDLGPVDDPVGRLMLLQPKRLAWNEVAGNTGEFDGFIAHEVTPVSPEAVVGEKDAMNGDDIAPQGLDTSKLVPLLTAALQEALTTIAELVARVDALESA